ncbi:nucleolar complex protein 2-like protein [Chrysochromulina tobinii]|uniref:Nucleolar complex protein 2-like protein n=1 Tax=Chrysochromulina tobinii TaxID=1460289 RepID=A0A0M0JJE3_9EUKA|nr:nucleolar complex protein 2-like protein [Chrysochromulina tobinii]|eukprot:KOO26363.1 nucleolar complex protein 2-like protein [Chrysochromulina sp. CCMP291]
MCAVDAQAAYRHAFVYIRQLAIHLRNAIQKATPEATRQVYNWQYVNCLRVWAQVPVAPLLLEALRFAELNKTPKNARTERPVDWSVLVKVSGADSTKRIFQEGLVQEALYLLAEHLGSISHSIAFPELAAPTVLQLRAMAKASKIVALQKRCKRLLAQVEAQARFVATRRDAVEFAPSDEKASNGFLADEKAAGTSPYSKWFKSEREEQQRLEAQRRAEAEAQGSGGPGKKAAAAVEGKSAKKRAAQAKRAAASTVSADDAMALPDKVGVLRMEDL